jgi:hypothetical protein
VQSQDDQVGGMSMVGLNFMPLRSLIRHIVHGEDGQTL